MTKETKQQKANLENQNDNPATNNKNEQKTMEKDLKQSKEVNTDKSIKS